MTYMIIYYVYIYILFTMYIFILYNAKLINMSLTLIIILIHLSNHVQKYNHYVYQALIMYGIL